MYLERRTVSRKTPGDGMLEITRQAALRIQQLGHTFAIDVAGESGAATLESFECTCRGPANRHVHYFLESELLKALTPETNVDCDLDGNQVIVRPAP